MKKYIFFFLLITNISNAQVKELVRYNFFRRYGYVYFEPFDIYDPIKNFDEYLWYDDIYLFDKIKEYNNLSQNYKFQTMIINNEKFIFFQNGKIDSLVYRFNSDGIFCSYKIYYSYDKIKEIKKYKNGKVQIYSYFYDTLGRLKKEINQNTNEKQSYFYFSNYDKLTKYEYWDSLGNIIMKDSIVYNDSLDFIEIFYENNFYSKFKIINSSIRFTSNQTDPNRLIDQVEYYFFDKEKKISRKLCFYRGVKHYALFDNNCFYNEDNLISLIKLYILGNYEEFVYTYKNRLLNKVNHILYRQNGNIDTIDVNTYRYE